MPRRRAILIFALLAVACGRHEAPARTGEPPHRVVCLTPSTTEIVRAVGAIDLVVGVDQYSAQDSSLDDVPALRSLPQVGSFLAPNLEAILALHPDIVLLDAVQSRVVEGLNSSGINFLPLPMQNISDVRAALVSVGAALGHADAGRAAQAQLDANLAVAGKHASDAVARTGKRPRVLFIVDRRAGGLAGMVAAGPGTYIDELLTRAGADNVLHDAPVRYVQIAAEEVVARAPDVILDAMHDGDPTKATQDWDQLASIPAVRDHRVFILRDPMYVTPGPRLDAALAGVVELLWK